jgi:hypothetical protein
MIPVLRSVRLVGSETVMQVVSLWHDNYGIQVNSALRSMEEGHLQRSWWDQGKLPGR